MSSEKHKIDQLLHRLKNPDGTPIHQNTTTGSSRPRLPLSFGGSQEMKRPNDLRFHKKEQHNAETENKLKEIMKISGKLTINNVVYHTDIKDMEDLEELGNGTCGHVYKMRHKPSNEIIAVKQMRRSGNSDETKRIIMDIEVVLKSHDCKYIVHCLGCFITESEVWICMELMATCFDKLLKRLKLPIPERILGKVTVATVEALSYLKDKHGVMHRDVKPSNILLDEKGNVKLCDFGISGRLVDSMAKTRSAGCAAYMAPERIEPNPENPDYDVRADVWSLGITLVELATGVFPYQDCKTDFEVLAKVINQDPPTLPTNQDFSSEFRDFVQSCLRKEHQRRPKYLELKKHAFINRYRKEDVNVSEWFRNAIQEADKAADRQTGSANVFRRFFTQHQTSQEPSHTFQQTPNTLANGNQNSRYLSLSKNDQSTKNANEYHPLPLPVSDGRSVHNSRLSKFQLAERQKETNLLNHDVEKTEKSYSPFKPLNNYLGAIKLQQKVDPYISLSQANTGNVQENINKFNSPILQRRVLDNTIGSPHSQKRGLGENRWKSPCVSPLRSQIDDEQQYAHGNTSPIMLQRLYHQQKQQQLVKEVEEEAKSNPGKKRFTSYIKLQLSSDRSGRSSRHQSPEPPPRLNRTSSIDNQSPFLLRKNAPDVPNLPSSPSLSRRYVSPTPPVPPPRRLSESTSVPGSPQNLRARFHYTPELHRRFQNDLS